MHEHTVHYVIILSSTLLEFGIYYTSIEQFCSESYGPETLAQT